VQRAAFAGKLDTSAATAARTASRTDYEECIACQ